MYFEAKLAAQTCNGEQTILVVHLARTTIQSLSHSLSENKVRKEKKKGSWSDGGGGLCAKIYSSILDSLMSRLQKY